MELESIQDMKCKVECHYDNEITDFDLCNLTCIIINTYTSKKLMGVAASSIILHQMYI